MHNAVRDLRHSRGLSQNDLAEQLGVSRQTVISIEKGRYCPSLPLAFQLARLFSCRIEDLFFPNED